jgi:arginyl-tRNA synthetase
VIARDAIVAAVAGAMHELGYDNAGVPVVVERPRDAAHGDIATPVAMSLAKILKKNPMEIAERLVSSLQVGKDVVASVEAVRPGFINFRLAAPVLEGTVRDVLEAGDGYGRTQDGAGQRVQVEYVSANPTGPLVVVSARAAAVGNAILNLLDFAGYATHGEYYVNDYFSMPCRSTPRARPSTPICSRCLQRRQHF